MKKIILLLLLLLTLALRPGEAGLAAEQDFDFHIDSVAGQERVAFDLVLKNNSNTPLAFEFPTSQKYEIKVIDSNGMEVYKYSEGLAFAQALETLSLMPMDAARWKEEWDYQAAGTRVKEGDYRVLAELKATSLNGEPVDKTLKKDQETLYIPGENPVFRAVKVEGSKGHYTVTGESKPTKGKFFYTVEDGHYELVSETEYKTDSKEPGWQKFIIHISIPKEKLPGNGTLILNLYERSMEGSIIHTYPVLLERFNNEVYK